MSDAEFPFPFKPYQVQLDFMKQLYNTLENGSIGIFESPTGTGKSLSIICSALKWLKDNQLREEKELLSVTAIDDEPDWVAEQYMEQKKQQLITDRLHNTEKRARRELRVERSRKRFKKATDVTYDEIEDLEISSSNSDESDTEDAYVTKIFYCSRTHSQLSQFLNELVKSPFNNVKVTTLGSRKNLCVNPEINTIKSNAVMNEKCLELKKGKCTKEGNNKGDVDKENKKEEKKTKKISKCPYYGLQKVKNYTTHILSSIQDIESLVKDATISQTCPYYATRQAVPAAQLVLLPYNMILHKEQRKALNIKLKNNIVIIDEAHNLIETINSIHSITVSYNDCLSTKRKLNLYLKSVKSRLKPINLLHCKQIIHAIELIAKVFSKFNIQQTYLLNIGDFLTKSELSDLNLFELVKYISESHLRQKIQGYDEDEGGIKIHSRSALGELCSLFTCLTNADTAGRVLIVNNPGNQQQSNHGNQQQGNHGNQSQNGSYIRYISLNCEDPFSPLIKQCRSVILAGGTMEPMGEIEQQLLNNSQKRLDKFTCGHVIPPDNLLPITLSHGAKMELNFSFEGRKKSGMLIEVGNVLLSLSHDIPGGIVCFFPSYECLNNTHGVLKKCGLLDKISKIKTIFVDSGGGTNVEEVLQSYSKRVENSVGSVTGNTGAVLFSVLGGKMSEGINFSNDMGRAVIVVGLPFGNPSDPVLQEKMKYLNNTLYSTETGRTPGQTYYENNCMKSVNQAVGRAIRHSEDYATIILLDKRYSTERIYSKLPSWIRSLLKHSQSLDSASKLVEEFFVKKTQK